MGLFPWCDYILHACLLQQWVSIYISQLSACPDPMEGLTDQEMTSPTPTMAPKVFLVVNQKLTKMITLKLTVQKMSTSYL